LNACASSARMRPEAGSGREWGLERWWVWGGRSGPVPPRMFRRRALTRIHHLTVRIINQRNQRAARRATLKPIMRAAVNLHQLAPMGPPLSWWMIAPSRTTQSLPAPDSNHRSLPARAPPNASTPARSSRSAPFATPVCLIQKADIFKGLKPDITTWLLHIKEPLKTPFICHNHHPA